MIQYVRCPAKESGWEYDYYVLHDGQVYGMASCDDELYSLSHEEAKLFRQRTYTLRQI